MQLACVHVYEFVCMWGGGGAVVCMCLRVCGDGGMCVCVCGGGGGERLKVRPYHSPLGTTIQGEGGGSRTSSGHCIIIT